MLPSHVLLIFSLLPKTPCIVPLFYALTGTFTGKTELETLSLGENNLDVLQVGIFSDLISLRDLWLDSNNIGIYSTFIFKRGQNPVEKHSTIDPSQ